MGDREFTDYLNRKVNLRRVAYLGSGQLDIPEEKHMVYGACALPPPLVLMSACRAGLSRVLSFLPSVRPTLCKAHCV